MSCDYCEIEQLQKRTAEANCKNELQKRIAEAQLNCKMNRKRKMELGVYLMATMHIRFLGIKLYKLAVRTCKLTILLIPSAMPSLTVLVASNPRRLIGVDSRLLYLLLIKS